MTLQFKHNPAPLEPETLSAKLYKREALTNPSSFKLADFYTNQTTSPINGWGPDWGSYNVG